MVKFSVIIPVHNVEKYVNRCIDSLLSQNYQNFEAILVDDGSTDNSLLICRDREKQDNRIKVIQKPNGGVSSARNEGIKNATGEYLLFLDADDEFTSGLLDHCNEFIKTHDGVDTFNFSSTDCYESGEEIPADIFKSGEYLFDSENEKADFFFKLLGGGYLVSVCWRSCYKKDFLTENGLYFDENHALAEDVLFYFQVFMLSKKYIETGYVGYRHWQLAGSCCHKTVGKIKLNEVNEISRKLKAFEESLGLNYFSEKHFFIHYWLIEEVAFGFIDLKKISDAKKYATEEIYFRDGFYVENTKKALKRVSVKYNEFRPQRYTGEKCRRALMCYSLNKNRMTLKLRLFFLKISLPFVRLNARIKRRLKGLFNGKKAKNEKTV